MKNGKFETPRNASGGKGIALIVIAVIAVIAVAALAFALTRQHSDVVPSATAEASTTAPTAVPTTAPTTEPTTVPTTEPAPVYRNPLNGTILEEPFTDRIFANTISNIPDAIPHVGVNQADILVECFVNGSIIRCLALYTDIESVDAIGSTRSTRLMFNDIAQHYSAVLTHAGGSDQALKDANSRGINHYNIDSIMRQAGELAQGVAYRDKEYKYGEHNLFGIGSGIHAYVEAQGVDMTLERDYGFLFAEDAVPADGEDAQSITIDLVVGKYKKETIMEYDSAAGKYTFYQYGKMMADQITEVPEQFRNVVIQFADITMNGIYQQADFLTGGTGYYACGGKIIPMQWTCEGDEEPFRYWTMDGEPLYFSEGNSYIAICSPESPVTYTGAEPTTEPTAEPTETTQAP